MWKLFFILIFVPYVKNAKGNQDMPEIDKGIRFVKGLTWSQIKEKAKAENKYIFVDCFATWCGPCKMMDKNIYPSKTVGNLVNTHLIAVKVQMDITKKDNENVKSWYADALLIQTKYKVKTFPSFLFFSPEGELVCRDVGYKVEESFLSLVANAINPAKRYSKLLKDYQQGKKDYVLMPHLAKSAKSFGEDSLSNTIAKDYKENYLDKLKENQLRKKEYFDFIVQYPQLLSSKDNFFKLCYYKPDIVNKFMYSSFSQKVVEYVLTKEEINAKLWRNGRPVIDDPEWDAIATDIACKYNTLVARHIVLLAKLRWYNYHEDWPNVIKYNIERIERYGLDTAGLAKVGLNNMIYNVIFMHSSNMTELNKGIKWMEIILKTDPNSHPWLDTYANLLYKVGRAKEAIKVERRALALVEKIQDENSIKLYKTVIDKMTRGVPTWD